MNAFQKVLDVDAALATRLGMPLPDAARLRRIDVMSHMTGGKGFRVAPGKTPKPVRATGKPCRGPMNIDEAVECGAVRYAPAQPTGKTYAANGSRETARRARGAARWSI